MEFSGADRKQQAKRMAHSENSEKRNVIIPNKYKKEEKKMNKLFENPGTTVKNVAKILFVIMVISCIILAFALGTEKYYDRFYDSHNTRILWPVFLAFLIGGPIGTYLSSLYLYAFGDLVESVGDLVMNLGAVRMDLNDLKKEAKDMTKEEVKSETRRVKVTSSPTMTETGSFNLSDYV